MMIIIIFTELSCCNDHIITVIRVFVPVISGDGGLAVGAAVTAGSRHTSPRHIPPAQLQQHRLIEHHGVLLPAHAKQNLTITSVSTSQFCSMFFNQRVLWWFLMDVTSQFSSCSVTTDAAQILHEYKWKEKCYHTICLYFGQNIYHLKLIKSIYITTKKKKKRERLHLKWARMPLKLTEIKYI